MGLPGAPGGRLKGLDGSGQSNHPGHDWPVGGCEGCPPWGTKRRVVQSGSNVIGSHPYDPRWLLFRTRCLVMLPYRLLREGGRFIAKHHQGFGVWALRYRRPRWRGLYINITACQKNTYPYAGIYCGMPVDGHSTQYYSSGLPSASYTRSINTYSDQRLAFSRNLKRC